MELEGRRRLRVGGKERALDVEPYQAVNAIRVQRVGRVEGRTRLHVRPEERALDVEPRKAIDRVGVERVVKIEGGCGLFVRLEERALLQRGDRDEIGADRSDWEDLPRERSQLRAKEGALLRKLRARRKVRLERRGPGFRAEKTKPVVSGHVGDGGGRRRGDQRLFDLVEPPVHRQKQRCSYRGHGLGLLPLRLLDDAQYPPERVCERTTVENGNPEA